MEDALLIITPCIVIVILLSLVFGLIAFIRYLHYKEIVALAEKGLIHPKYNRANGTDTLRWGVIITAIGLALCLGIYPLGFIDGFGRQFPLWIGPWMLIGFIPTFFGLGLIVIYWVTRKDEARSTGKAEHLSPLPQPPPTMEPQTHLSVHQAEEEPVGPEIADD